MKVASNGAFSLSWSAQTGKTYRVQSKDRLEAIDWTLVSELIAGGKTASVTNLPPTPTAQRYYRVLRLD
ncbi:MAG: hypothetical protein HY043_13015 [Verrucomicrobia bacterium]|nr:hypothetical protein [Verrucomicrobiota bacterium]